MRQLQILANLAGYYFGHLISWIIFYPVSFKSPIPHSLLLLKITEQLLWEWMLTGRWSEEDWSDLIPLSLAGDAPSPVLPLTPNLRTSSQAGTIDTNTCQNLQKYILNFYKYISEFTKICVMIPLGRFVLVKYTYNEYSFIPVCIILLSIYQILSLSFFPANSK